VKPLQRRRLADSDIADAIDYYATESPTTALRFVDALEQALRHIQKHPATGSPRYAHELDIPGLRCWPLKRFSYLAFYREQSTAIELWRVLHSRRDIPEWLSEITE
jgi:toxin ParE1/3/4